jgi:hypothetical protein
MCFVVIESRKFDAFQPTLALAAYADGRVAAARAAQVLCEPFAYLWNGDRRRPLFSPAAIPCTRTRWPSGKA